MQGRSGEQLSFTNCYKESIVENGYHVYKDRSSQYRWRFAQSGRVLADSGEGYYNKQDCLNAMATVMATTTSTAWYDHTV